MTTYDYTAYELHGNKSDFMKLLDIFINLYLGTIYIKKILRRKEV